MDWGLLAGGVSQGLNQAQQGVNQGTLQGEQVRAGRAQEGLAQQHLGLQQQQLTNALAQQAFNRYLAQEQLGLHRDQLAAQRDYHSGMLGYHAGQLGIQQDEAARHRALLPSQVRKNEAEADWYGTYRPQYYNQWNDIRNRGMDIRQQRVGDQASEADRRLALLQAKTKAAIERSPQMTPFQRARMQQYQTQLRDLRYAVSIASKREADGLPVIKGQPSLQDLMARINDVEAEQEQFAYGMAGAPEGGMPQTRPGQVNLQQALEALGLK